MKLVAISDTHNLHHSFGKLPQGDVIIHAGDFTTWGKTGEVRQFRNWFASLPYAHKICIAGNHDRCMEHMFFLKDDFKNAGITYLQDSSVEINGIRFYGSPRTPEFCDFAFMYERGQAHWEGIPDNTNILITHGPPQGILDLCPDGRNVGCVELLERTHELADLKYHIFGHIHEAYGIQGKYVNASNHTMLWKNSGGPGFTGKSFEPITLGL